MDSPQDVGEPPDVSQDVQHSQEGLTSDEKPQSSEAAICPFVCGICSSKFDKVSKFYAHLKTHRNFESLAKTDKKKDEMLEALNVAGKVDENVLKCGICEIEFPSMSLLHDHMVCEENISSYNYCEKDHTARPHNNKTDTINDDSEAKASEDEVVTKRGRGRPRKDANQTISTPPAGDKERVEKEEMVRRNSPRKNEKVDDKKRGSQKFSPKGKIETPQPPKRKTGKGYESDDKDDAKNVNKTGKKRTKNENEHSDGEVSLKSMNMTKKSEDIGSMASPGTRISSRRSAGRVNYKALAGYGNEPEIKIEPPDIVDNSPKQSARVTVKTETLTDSDSDYDSGSGRKARKTRAKKKSQVTVKLDGSEEISNDFEEAVKTRKSVTVKVNRKDKGNGIDKSEVMVADRSDIDKTAVGGPGDKIDDKEANGESERDDTEGKQTGLKEDTETFQGKMLKKNMLFSCNVCGIILTHRALKKHKVSHLEALTIECSICKKVFKSKLHLSHHIRSVHRGPKYRCAKCRKQFKGKQSLDKHMALHILKKEIEEMSIDEVEYEVIDDGQDDNVDNPDEAAVSVKVSFDKGRMETVINKNIMFVKPKNSDELLEEYRAGKLAVRIGSRPGDKRVKCTICNTIFAHGKSFKRHMRKIHLSDRFLCKICREVFRFRRTFEIHMRDHIMKQEVYNLPEGVSPMRTLGESEDENSYDENHMDEIAEIEEDVEYSKEMKRDTDIPVKSGQYDTVEGRDVEGDREDDTEGGDTGGSERNESSGTDREHDYCVESPNKRKNGKNVDDTHTPHLVVEPLAADDIENNEDDEEHVYYININTNNSKNKTIGFDGEEKDALQCPSCDYMAKCEEGLIKHQLVHTDVVNQICDICDRVFDSVVQLKKHKEATHSHNTVAYTCFICGEQLKSRHSSYGHKAKHLMKTDPYYSEEIVRKLQEEEEEEQRENKQRLAEEQEQAGVNRTTGRKRGPGYKGDQLVNCDICSKMIRAKRLKRHMETHVTTKDHKCNLCGKFYKSLRYLKDHLTKTHKKNADAVCELCGNVYKGARYLEVHMQTHGPKDKMCPHCGKGFTTALYLRTHLQTHLEKKSFKCPHCGSGFSHRARLMIHLAELHGKGERKACKYCQQMFPSRQRARMHERKAHEGFKLKKRDRNRRKSYNVAPNSAIGYYIYDRNNTSNNGDREVGVCYDELEKQDDEEVVTEIASKVVAACNSSGHIVDGDGVVVPTHLDKFETVTGPNGREYKVVVQKSPVVQEVELVKLEGGVGGEQNIVIQNAESGEYVETVGAEMSEVVGLVNDKNFEEQVLEMEIPEDTQQCQIILYPDGSFKLLNVLEGGKDSV